MRQTIKLNESELYKMIAEAVNTVVNESMDTEWSAIRKWADKIPEIEKKYGANSHYARHKAQQLDNIRDDYYKKFREASPNRKARLDKNMQDMNRGKRVYVNGEGWKTKEDANESFDRMLGKIVNESIKRYIR